MEATNLNGLEMPGTGNLELRSRYIAAVGSFIDKLRTDPNILAVVVSGSLAYDVIWEKSDVDMTVVVRDQLLKTESYSIVEDGVTLNCGMVTRSEFKRNLERNTGGSFGQSYYAKGKMVYTTDESLREFFEDVKRIGEDDKALSMMIFANMLAGTLDKCRKWLTACRDPLYAQYFLLDAAELIADMELCLRGEPASRASIRKVLARDPDCLKPFYQEPMSHRYTEAEVAAGIEELDAYLVRHLDIIKKPVLEFLADGELKTCTLIAKHFHLEPHFIVGIFDYLAEKSVIEKASQTIRITPKGRQVFEEIGYLYLGD